MDDREVTFLIAGGEVKPLITIPASSTVLQLKKKIAEEIGVPVNRQNLLLGNMNLLDLTTIDEYGFGDITQLILAVDIYPDERFIGVNVLSPAFNVRLTVNKEHKVIQLKKRIGQIFSIPTESFTLWYMSKEMLDDKPLYKYYISEGCNIQFTRAGFCT